MNYFRIMIKTIVVASFVGTVVICYGTFFMQTMSLPPLTSMYAVGTSKYHFIDKSREEMHINNPAHPYRELMVQIWYPTKNDSSATPVFYDPLSIALRNQFLHEHYWIPLYFLNHLSPIKTHSIARGKLYEQEAKKYPLVLFSHGIGAFCTSNTMQCENLASHGYVVASVCHPYGTAMTEFPDGRSVRTASVEWDNESAIWVQDLQYVIDTMSSFNDPTIGISSSMLDLDNIGAFGHSLGGSVATELCRMDKRIKACVNLDGGPFSKNDKELRVPYMFMTGQAPNNVREKEWSEDKMSGLLNFFSKLPCDTYCLVIKGAAHRSFTDDPFIMSTSMLLKVLDYFSPGTIDAQRVNAIINTYMSAFFDSFLKGTASPLLNCQKKVYPEVEMYCSHPMTCSNHIGVREFEYTDKRRIVDGKSRVLKVVVWYPIKSLGHVQKKIEHGIWYLKNAAQDAAILFEGKKLPLILFSHGYGGGAYQNAWFAQQLASNGYIVANVDHYGNTYENMILEVGARPWNRPIDMSFVLDQLLQEPFFVDYIDVNRIGAAGFSQGGMTSLWLAGVKADLTMEKVHAQMKDIKDDEWRAVYENITDKDLEPANQSYRDERIKAVFTMAPGIEFNNWIFTAQGLSDVTIPVYIVAGESDDIVSISQNAQFFADNLKNAHLTILQGKVTHWVFMNEPNAKGKEYVPFITVDDPSVNRVEVHEKVGSMAVDFFNKYL